MWTSRASRTACHLPSTVPTVGWVGIRQLPDTSIPSHSARRCGDAGENSTTISNIRPVASSGDCLLWIPSKSVLAWIAVLNHEYKQNKSTDERNERDQ